MNPKLTYIQDLIRQGELLTAINQLLQVTKDSKHYRESIVHSANYKELNTNERKGILSSEDIGREKRRIANSLIEFVQELNSNVAQLPHNNVQNTDLLDSIKLSDNKPITINIENKAMSQGNIAQTHSGSGDNVAGDKNTTYNYNSQNVTEVITEVQTISQQVAKEYPNDKTTQGLKTVEIINNNATLKQKLITAAKEGGLAALEKALDNPVGAFAIVAIKGWMNS